jgi:hypothetical protein
VNEEFTLSLQTETDAKIILDFFDAGLIPASIARDALRRCSSTIIAEALEDFPEEKIKDLFEKENQGNDSFKKLAESLGVKK